MNHDELTALFRKLGARDPESWARSQVQGRIPQLTRFLFLRQAWRQIVSEGDSRWIDQAIQRARTHPNEPYAGVGHALEKLRARGATDEEITDVVRGMQAGILFSFCYLLEDPGDLEPEVADIAWPCSSWMRMTTCSTGSEDCTSRCSRPTRPDAGCARGGIQASRLDRLKSSQTSQVFLGQDGSPARSAGRRHCH